MNLYVRLARLVGQSVGESVCHNFLKKGRKLHFHAPIVALNLKPKMGNDYIFKNHAACRAQLPLVSIGKEHPETRYASSTCLFLITLTHNVYSVQRGYLPYRFAEKSNVQKFYFSLNVPRINKHNMGGLIGKLLIHAQSRMITEGKVLAQNALLLIT